MTWKARARSRKKKKGRNNKINLTNAGLRNTAGITPNPIYWAAIDSTIIDVGVGVPQLMASLGAGCCHQNGGSIEGCQCFHQNWILHRLCSFFGIAGSSFENPGGTVWAASRQEDWEREGNRKGLLDFANSRIHSTCFMQVRDLVKQNKMSMESLGLLKTRLRMELSGK